jgi:hypothetical protein
VKEEMTKLGGGEWLRYDFKIQEIQKHGSVNMQMKSDGYHLKAA